MTKISYATVESKLKEYGQSHLLAHFNDLTKEQQQEFLTKLGEINMEVVKQTFETFKQNNKPDKLDELMRPISRQCFASLADASPEQRDCWETEGLQQIADGKVGVVLLAGGQGTRLGVNYPKGMFDVGLKSKKTLYQIKAERIARLQQLAFQKTGKRGFITWYIMTSEATMEQTREFFAKHEYFGLKENNVKFFEQYTLPCMNFDGKILLSAKNKVASAPDGNGGLYRALVDRGVLENMEERGVQHLHVLCVDNILVRIADPVFIGFCKLRNADCGAKVVKKLRPDEAVGVVCQVNGVYQVVEYSEVTDKTSQLRDEHDNLVFNAGNICNHYFTIQFLQHVCRQQNGLPLHIAKKKIPFINKDGEIEKPQQPNGIKMEKFVFDVFKYSQRFAVFDVPRHDEFSPLKNSEGASNCSPLHSRWSLASLHHRRLVRAGGSICDDNGKEIPPLDTFGDQIDGEYPVRIEISPLVSYDGEGLEDLVRGKPFTSPVYLESTSEPSA